MSVEGEAPRTRVARLPAARSLLKTGAATVFIKGFAAVLSLAMLAGLTRAMSADEYGRFAFCLSFAMVASVAVGMGYHTGILRWRPEHEAEGDADKAEAAERWALNMTLAISLIACGAVALALRGVDLLMTGDLAVGAAGLDEMEGALALTVPLAASTYLSSALRARGAIIWALLPREIIWRAGVTAVAGAALMQKWELDAAQTLWVSAGILASLSFAQAAAFGVRPGRQLASAPALGFRGAARVWNRRAGPMWGSSFLSSMQRYFEVVLLGLFVAPAMAGLYFSALSIAHVLSLSLMAGNLVAGPHLSRAWHGGDKAGAQKLLNVMMLAIAGPTLAGLLLIVVLAPYLLAVFDPTFAEWSGLLILLSVGTGLNALAGCTSLTLMLAGEERRNFRILALSLGLATVAQLIAIPIIGVWGAAIFNVAGGAMRIVWTRHVCVTRLGLDPTVYGLAKEGWRRFSARRAD
ncbi:MAG: lipopolysaccharide biosynthesis protein [Pseudomonadota bacterium]